VGASGDAAETQDSSRADRGSQYFLYFLPQLVVNKQLMLLEMSI